MAGAAIEEKLTDPTGCGESLFERVNGPENVDLRNFFVGTSPGTQDCCVSDYPDPYVDVVLPRRPD